MKLRTILRRRAEKWQIDPALAVSLLHDLLLIQAKQVKVVAIRDVQPK